MSTFNNLSMSLERLTGLYQANLSRNGRRAAENRARIDQELAEANEAANDEFARAFKELVESAHDAEREREFRKEREEAERTIYQEVKAKLDALRAKYEPDAVKAEEPEAEPDESDEDDLDEEDEADDDSDPTYTAEPEWTDHGTHWTRDADEEHAEVTVPMVTGKHYMLEFMSCNPGQELRLNPFTGFVGYYVLGKTGSSTIAVKVAAEDIETIAEIPGPTVAEGAL